MDRVLVAGVVIVLLAFAVFFTISPTGFLVFPGATETTWSLTGSELDTATQTNITVDSSGASLTTSSWWNDDYAYRKKLEVTGTATDYTVNTTLNTATLIAAGKMQADCDDLRVVSSTELNRVVENCDSATTSVFFKSDIPETFYIYYGNSAATSAPTENVFNWQSVWTAADQTSGTWVSNSLSGDYSWRVLVNDSTAGDFIRIRFSAGADTTVDDIAIAERSSDPRDTVGTTWTAISSVTVTGSSAETSGNWTEKVFFPLATTTDYSISFHTNTNAQNRYTATSTNQYYRDGAYNSDTDWSDNAPTEFSALSFALEIEALQKTTTTETLHAEETRYSTGTLETYLDANETVEWNNISWSGDASMDIATSNDAATWSWTNTISQGTLSVSNARYFKWKATLTGNETSPVLSQVNVTFSDTSSITAALDKAYAAPGTVVTVNATRTSADSMNATFNKGTSLTSDDVTVEMVQVGGNWTANYTIPSSPTAGTWGVAVKAYSGASLLDSTTKTFTAVDPQLSCEAGGAYSSGEDAVVKGVFTNSDSAVSGQTVTLTVAGTGYTPTTDSNGNFSQNASVNTGTHSVSGSVTYNTFTATCSDSFTMLGTGTLSLLKSAVLANQSSSVAWFTVELNLSNTGGEALSDITINDEEYSFELSSLAGGATVVRSYALSFDRGAANKTKTLPAASATGYSDAQWRNASSSTVSIVVEKSQLREVTVTKTVSMVNQTEGKLFYRVETVFENTGMLDLEDVEVEDSDLGVDEVVDLEVGEDFSAEMDVEVTKKSTNFEVRFEKAFATVDSVVFWSAAPIFEVNAFTGGPFDISAEILDRVAEGKDLLVKIELVNKGGAGVDAVLSYWIDSGAVTKKTIFVGAEPKELTLSLEAPGAGEHIFHASVDWGVASASASAPFESLKVVGAGYSDLALLNESALEEYEAGGSLLQFDPMTIASVVSLGVGVGGIVLALLAFCVFVVVSYFMVRRQKVEIKSHEKFEATVDDFEDTFSELS